MHKLAFVTIACALMLAGCGSTKSAAPPATQPTTTSSPPAGSPAGLQAEATAAATGDIPDNQVFLVFANARARYSMKYPEGWAQSGTGNKVTIHDKNNIVRVQIEPAPLPSSAKIKSALAGARIVSGPTRITINGKIANRVTYSTKSAPNAVTGKRVTLIVDRYYIPHGSRVAIVDLGTAQGVDNVDAYRLMIESFRWK